MAVKAGYVPDRELYRRVKRMLLMGFNNVEMLPSLEQGVSFPVTLLDVDECVDYIQAEWDARPEAKEVRLAENELWQRSSMFKNDMLDLYQKMLRNAVATLEGEYTHPDDTPVIATKPSEVAAMAEKILKIERDVTKEKNDVLRLLGAASSLSDTSTTNAEMFKLSEDEDEELDQEDIRPPERTSL